MKEATRKRILIISIVLCVITFSLMPMAIYMTASTYNTFKNGDANYR